MTWATRRLPAAWKRRLPIVRERDALRQEVLRLRTRQDPPSPQPFQPPLRGTYIGSERMLIAPSWGGRLLVSSEDISLTPELVVSGTYDAPFTNYVQRYIGPGDTVFDVGANVGLFTVLLAYQVWDFGKVVAYEPNPRMLELLRDNVSMNWLNDRVEIVPKAAADRSESLELLAPRRFAMTGSTRPVAHLLATPDRLDTIERIAIEAEPLDVHIGRFERVDLVKIDVEGAEDRVLAGMQGLLASGIVRRVSFEVSRELMGEDWDPFTHRLTALENSGWSFATISDAGDPEPIELEAVFSRGRFSQILMTRA